MNMRIVAAISKPTFRAQDRRGGIEVGGDGALEVAAGNRREAVQVAVYDLGFLCVLRR
jgi:hypothetical protein